MVEKNCSRTEYTYSPIVRGYCLQGRIEEAIKLIDDMARDGCSPSSVIYNVVIDALCKSRNFDEVGRIMSESGLKGWEPNEATYNTYMNGLCKAGRAAEALEQLKLMLGLARLEDACLF